MDAVRGFGMPLPIGSKWSAAFTQYEDEQRMKDAIDAAVKACLSKRENEEEARATINNRLIPKSSNTELMEELESTCKIPSKVQVANLEAKMAILEEKLATETAMRASLIKQLRKAEKKVTDPKKKNNVRTSQLPWT